MASSDKNENYFRQGLPYMFALQNKQSDSGPLSK